MIEPSKSPRACGVVMAKTKGWPFRFCRDFRYLNAERGNDIGRITVGRRKIIHDVGFGLCFLASALLKLGSRENGLCVSWTRSLLA